jgi:hypothetical protein
MIIHKFLGIDYSASLSDQQRLPTRWHPCVVEAEFSKK